MGFTGDISPRNQWVLIHRQAKKIPREVMLMSGKQWKCQIAGPIRMSGWNSKLGSKGGINGFISPTS